jgi:hypothetical protein
MKKEVLAKNGRFAIKPNTLPLLIRLGFAVPGGSRDIDEF